MRTKPMTLHEWLINLSDEYLIAWANKGLMRRGQKLLTAQNPQTWSLASNRAQARLDDTEQHLHGIGFDYLHCSCASVGPCHHLIAFLIGLRQRLKQQTAEIDTFEAETNPDPDQPSPWLITDLLERQKELGKSNLEQAQRWLAQGLESLLTEQAEGLHAELPEPLSARVMIPRSGGISMSLCSCKEPRCAHRALVILQICRDSGVDEETTVDALTNGQREVLGSLNQWLRLLALQGMSGMPRLQIERARGLVTELQQVDLPLPGRQLARVAEMLEQEWQHQSISSPARLRESLAPLYANLSALSLQPLPQPLADLAGRHRRRYKLRRDLDLIGISLEVWKTLSGFHGYSAYFYAPKEDCFYQLSEARNLELDPNWQPLAALNNARFGHYRLSNLIGSHFRLLRGWASEDRRLSAREDCQLSDLEAKTDAALFSYASDLAQISLRLADKVKTNPYGLDLDPYAMIGVKGAVTLSFDRYQQHWHGEGYDRFGRVFKLTLPNTAQANLATQQLLNIASVQALFGRWRIQTDYLCLEPIAVWHDDKMAMLRIGDLDL